MNILNFNDFINESKTYLEQYTDDELEDYGWTRSDVNMLKLEILKVNKCWKKIPYSDKIKLVIGLIGGEKEARENTSDDIGEYPLEIGKNGFRHLIDLIEEYCEENNIS